MSIPTAKRAYRHARTVIKQLCHAAGIPVNLEDRKLLRFRRAYRGRRCFIVGSGPSLRPGDLDLLAERGEICLSANKIFKIFPQTQWRPTLYAIEDSGVAHSETEEIRASIHCPILAASYLKECFSGFEAVTYFQAITRVSPPALPGFSRNLLDGINCGGTITYSMMQIAGWLGCTEIYLLGIDFNYNLPDLRPSQEYSGFKTYSPDNSANYFAADYIRPGEVVIAPDLESSLCAYHAAQHLIASGDIPPIYNATRGGKLEVFKRVEFDTLFK